MRRDELGILRFRYVRESEFDAIPEQNRDLYTRYVVFRDGSDEILYEYVYGQRLEFDKLQVVRDTQANIEALHSAGNISPYEVVFATDRRELGVSMDHGIVWFSPDASTAGFATIDYVDNQIASIDIDLSGYATMDYVANEIANVDVDLSDYTTKTYVDNAIANVSIDLSNYIQNEDIKEVISGVSYNNINHKITFNRYNDVDIVIDLPIEALLVGLSLDGDDLVLELEDGSTQRVPLNTLLVGVVKNVNGQTPNSNGEVNLNYTDLNNLPNLFSGNYEDLLNKPDFQDKLTAGDNITIDPVTNVISASGGGSEYELTKIKIDTALIGEGSQSIQLGYGSSAKEAQSLAIGINNTSWGLYSTSMGYYSTAIGLNSIAIGPQAWVSGQNSIAIGKSTTVSEDNVADFGSDRQVRVNLTPVHDRDAVSKSYLEDVISSIGGGSGGGPVDWADIENKPELFSKDYNDLINKPTLTTVATSGSYTDLTNKPVIPTKVSDLSNDTGYITGYTETDPIFTAWNKSTGISITKSQVSDLIEATQALPGLMSATDKERLDVLHALLEEDTENSVVDSINEVLAIFNNYPEGADLVTALAGKVDKVTGKGLSTNDYTTTEKNKLAGIASGAEVNVQSDWNAISGDAQILNKPTLTTVATSGSYNDLINLPNLFSGNYEDLINKPDLFSGNYEDLTNKPIIPDSSDFATTTYVDDKDTIKEQNNNTNIKFWTGTKAEYNSLGGWHMNTIYFITEE